MFIMVIYIASYMCLVTNAAHFICFNYIRFWGKNFVSSDSGAVGSLFYVAHIVYLGFEFVFVFEIMV